MKAAELPPPKRSRQRSGSVASTTPSVKSTVAEEEEYQEQPLSPRSSQTFDDDISDSLPPAKSREAPLSRTTKRKPTTKTGE